MHTVKHTIVFTMITILVLPFLGGCAGKTPHPIQLYRPLDASLTCAAIKEEITQNQQSMLALYPQTEKMTKNVALGVAGAFFFFPWFFMDFSNAEQVEIQAYQQRDNHLYQLAQTKECDQMPPAIQLSPKS